MKEKRKIGGGTPSKILVVFFSCLNKVITKRLNEETIFKTTAVIFIWISGGEGKEQNKNKVCVLVIKDYKFISFFIY